MQRDSRSSEKRAAPGKPQSRGCAYPRRARANRGLLVRCMIGDCIPRKGERGRAPGRAELSAANRGRSQSHGIRDDIGNADRTGRNESLVLTGFHLLSRISSMSFLVNGAKVHSAIMHGANLFFPRSTARWRRFTFYSGVLFKFLHRTDDFLPYLPRIIPVLCAELNFI